MPIEHQGTDTLFPPCPRCGAPEPGACQKMSNQDCALLLRHNKHYACRCCAVWLGELHDPYCKLAQGVVKMESATDAPLDFPTELPRGVEEVGQVATSSLTPGERRIIRRKNADEFMEATEEQKKRIFLACAEDAGDLACIYSLRLQPTYPRVVPELAMLVRRLAYALEHASPGHPLAEEAMNHLVDERMLGNLATMTNPETAQDTPVNATFGD